MSKLTLNFIFIFLILTFTSPTYSAVNNLYEEEISGYYEVSNEILRFDTKREFTISQYDTYNLELSGQNIPYVNISLIDDTTKGNLENIIQQIKYTNFIPTVNYNLDGSINSIEWDMNLFRLNKSSQANPFDPPVGNIFNNGSLNHRMFDLVVSSSEFTVALEYFEFQLIGDRIEKLKVNTELSTDNYDSGLVFRTNIHIIKRDSQNDIIYDYSQSIQESNLLSRSINLLDIPFLWVPFQFFMIIGLVYLYIKINDFLKKLKIDYPKEDQHE